MLGDFHRFPIQLNSTLLGKGSFGAWCHQVIQKLAQEKKIPVEEDEFDFLYFLSRSFGILWQLKIELLSLLLPCSVGPSPELSGPCAEKCKQITDGIFHRLGIYLEFHAWTFSLWSPARPIVIKYQILLIPLLIYIQNVYLSLSFLTHPFAKSLSSELGKNVKTLRQAKRLVRVLSAQTSGLLAFPYL